MEDGIQNLAQQEVRIIPLDILVGQADLREEYLFVTSAGGCLKID